MARLRRSTARYVRSALLAQFRKQFLPRLLEGIRYRMRDGVTPWRPQSLLWELDDIRPGVDMAESIPSPARSAKKTQLEEYEAALRKWKRARSVARSKVTKYSRLVRYHRKQGAKA